MFQTHLLTDGQVEALGDGVLRVLDRVGVWCQNDDLLDAVSAIGARVDHQAQRATFPPEVTRRIVDQVRAEGYHGLAVGGRFQAPGAPGLGTQVAQLSYDYPTRTRRSGNRADFVRYLKLGEMLHRESGVGHCLLMTDVDPLVEPLEAAMLLAEHATKPHPAFAWKVDQVDWLKEMGAILGRENWFAWGAICIAHPLRFDRDVADKFLRRVREGVATGVTGMPVAGMTTPLTVAGFVAVASAEIVAGWILARAVNPAVAVGGSVWAGSLDMRTGEVSYCSFDAMRYAFALTEFMRRWAGRDVPVGGGESCDAKEPGYFAAWEKAYKSMMIAAFTGRCHGVGQGMLEEGKTLCAEQLLLERELSGGLAMISGPLELDPDAFAFDDIESVGFGVSTNHLQCERTMLGFRDLAWCPPFLDRSGWRGEATDRAVLDRLHQQVEELIASYRQPEVDPDKLHAMRLVADRAAKALLS